MFNYVLIEKVQQEMALPIREFSSPPHLNDGHRGINQLDTHQNQSPRVFFLDHDVFQQALMEIPKPSAPVPLYISTLIGDDAQTRNITSQFFNTNHSYIPIVSKKLFYDRLLNPLTQPRGDVALLCLCMNLFIWSPEYNDNDPLTES
jgi:hypothetical protein